MSNIPKRGTAADFIRQYNFERERETETMPIWKAALITVVTFIGFAVWVVGMAAM